MRHAISALFVLIAVTLVTWFLWWAGGHTALPVAPLLYLPLVVAATLLGTAQGVVAALSSALAYHVFFVAPVATFRVAALSDAVSIAVYVATSVTISLLLSRSRDTAKEASRREELAAALQRVAAAGLALSPADPPARIAELVAKVVGSEACGIWVRRAGVLEPWAVHGMHPDELARAVPLWAEREDAPVSVTWRNGKTMFVVPVRASEGASGALALEDTSASRPLLKDGEFLRGLAGLVALFWARVQGAERELEAEAARRSDALKSSLLSMVSHELRSPLTAIKASAGSVLHAARAQEDRELLAGIESEADRMSNLVRNLLDASRVEAGQLRPDRHPVRLRRLVGELADRRGMSAERLELDIPADLYVDVDPVLLEQVFRNLFENSERHGKMPVRVAAHRENAIASVEVADRGRGASPDIMGRIFGRFVRGAGGGLGLGLSLCAAVVEAHGGTIEAHNAEGRGLAVTFSLPACDGEK